MRRLLSMEPSEVLWRAKSAARMPLDWLEHRGAGAVPPPSASGNGRPDFRYPIKAHSMGLPIETLQIFEKRFPVGTQLEWHRDYAHHKTVPQKFSRLLNIRDTEIVGDIKYVWEINRHQHLSALAYTSNNTEYGEYIVASIDSWMEANPYLKGVNWTSSLELALRIISWAFIYPAIKTKLGESKSRFEKFSASIYLHLREINRNLSLYSSANNHLIGEVASLYVGSICFDWWGESRLWRARAKEFLEKEILIQVHEDGVNKEQAMSYHLFTLELFLLALIVGTNAGDTFSESYLSRIDQMLIYLNSVATESGDLPWFGDSDDARGFFLSPFESNLQTVMELGGLFLREPSYLRFSKTPTAATRALLGDKQIASFEKLKGVSPTLKSRSIFEKGGVAILRGKGGEKLIMDFGDLGYTNIAAHGHADALSLLLVLDGRYFLIDPGTYAYHSHEKWRTYFRSTAAHNTIRLDRQDQSVMGGRFLWTTKAESRLLNYVDGEERAVVEAEHDGYRRLADPVTHRRKIVLDKRQREIVIHDTLNCIDRHEVELFFHFHEDAQIVDLDKESLQVIFHNRRVVFQLPGEPFKARLWKGTEDPIAGWRSSAFDRKQPINTLCISGVIQGTTTLTTTLIIS